jgi:hypothetical protein
METAMCRVAHSVDLATKLKRYIVLAENKRHDEEHAILRLLYDGKALVFREVAQKGLGDMTAYLNSKFDTDQIKVRMDNCKRLMAIESMWGGIGGLGVQDADSVRDPSAARKMVWRTLPFDFSRAVCAENRQMHSLNMFFHRRR